MKFLRSWRPSQRRGAGTKIGLENGSKNEKKPIGRTRGIFAERSWEQGHRGRSILPVKAYKMIFQLLQNRSRRRRGRGEEKKEPEVEEGPRFNQEESKLNRGT